MHNHDDNKNHDARMMWLMMLPCLLMPIIILVFFGRGPGLIVGNWQWIFPIAVMIGAHALMMKFMHNHSHCHSGKSADAKKEKKGKIE